MYYITLNYMIPYWESLYELLEIIIVDILYELYIVIHKKVLEYEEFIHDSSEITPLK